MKKALRSKVCRRLTRAAITIITIIVVLAGAGIGYTIYRFDQIHRIPVKGLAKDTGNAENILLIGSTDRCASKQIKVVRLECEQGLIDINSDVVMIVRIVPAAHRVTLLSIPRDTFVPDARTGGLDGTNSSTATKSVSMSLGRLGYRMIPTSSAIYLGPVSETTVVYSKGHLAQAERVESSLSGTVIMGMGTPASGADVSVIAGSDLTVANTSSPAAKTTAELRISPATASTRAAVVNATTRVASIHPDAQGASGNQNFSSPTSATTPLKPWDPRACPTSTG